MHHFGRACPNVLHIHTKARYGKIFKHQQRIVALRSFYLRLVWERAEAESKCDTALERSAHSWYSPWQHAQHQVQHEEGANDDEGNEVQPVPRVPWGIVGLKGNTQTKKITIISVALVHFKADFKRTFNFLKCKCYSVGGILFSAVTRPDLEQKTYWWMDKIQADYYPANQEEMRDHPVLTWKQKGKTKVTE